MNNSLLSILKGVYNAVIVLTVAILFLWGYCDLFQLACNTAQLIGNYSSNQWLEPLFGILAAVFWFTLTVGGPIGFIFLFIFILSQLLILKWDSK